MNPEDLFINPPGNQPDGPNLVEVACTRQGMQKMNVYQHLIKRAIEKCIPDESQRNFFLDNWLPIPSLTFQIRASVVQPDTTEQIVITFLGKTVLEASVAWGIGIPVHIRDIRESQPTV